MIQRTQSGFTLIEIMVGVTIALIGMVAMFQIQANWDRQQRSISSGGDAHVAGTISAFHIERDLRNAGMGFGNSSYLGCTVQANDAQRATTAFNFPLAPVLIVDGAGGAPDQIHVLYGSSSSLASTYTVASTSSTTTATGDTRNGLSPGDLVVISVPASPTQALGCSMAEITDTTTVADGRTVGHGAAAYTRSLTPPATRLAAGTGQCTGAGPWTCAVRYNPVAGSLNFPAADTPADTTGELRSLGDDPRLNVWAVDTTNKALTLRDRLHNGTASSVGDGIINLQAQYGLDTNGTGVVDTWTATDPNFVQATGFSAASSPNWTQLRAIRFALLLRGQDYDKAVLTATAPTWSGGAFVMTNVDGTADSGAGSLGVNNWRNYRYNVFEVTVPLPNLIWRQFWGP